MYSNRQGNDFGRGRGSRMPYQRNDNIRVEASNLLHMDNNEALVNFLENNSALQQQFNEARSTRRLLDLVRLTAKICKSQFINLKTKALIIINRTRFLENVEQCLNDPKCITNLNEFMIDLLTACETFHKVLNIKCDYICRSAITLTGVSKNIQDGYLRLQDQLSLDSLDLQLDRMNLNKNENSEPEDFRSMNLYPYQSEALREPISLSEPNFQNNEQYLEYLFRGLRYDFCRLVAESVLDYKNKRNSGVEKPEFLPYIFIYHTARFQRNRRERVKEFIGETVWFEKDPDADCEIMTRLKVGTLLLFTKDYFDTFCCGIILESNTEQLKKAKIIVRVFDDGKFSYDENYVMGEVQIYYEPYYRVMKILQTVQEIPFSRYLVHKENVVDKPYYLLNDTMYMIDGHRFPVLNENAWPDSSTLNLDQDQWNAFKYALTHEFAMIRGGHGTGKTEVALKVMKTLLENNRNMQIVVLCCSNSALDDILEKTLKWTTRIVRVGGYSKSEALAAYTVNEQLRKFKIYNSLAGKLYKEINEKTAEEHRNKFSDPELSQELSDLHKQVYDTNQYRYLQLFKKMKVIGLTTNGAANHHENLKRLQCPVVIAEEGTEISESHLLSALTENLQHFIVFGNSYDVDPKKLDFPFSYKNYRNENDKCIIQRLEGNGFPCHVLNYQHRMRPEISGLITSIIYHNMKDSPNVRDYGPIKGMEKTVYFVSHNKPETYDSMLSDKTNVYEVKFLLALAKYLKQQGNKVEDITVLLTHHGQLCAAEMERNQDLEGINLKLNSLYQGGENDIVLLSLLRSNEGNELGRLNFASYVVQLLTRARKGLYMIGNMDSLTSVPSIWSHIKEELIKMDSFGTSLPLKIGNNVKLVTTAEDFDSI